MSGLGNIFGGLFGGSKSAPVTPAPVTPVPAPVGPSKPVTSAGYLTGIDIYHENMVPDLTPFAFVFHKATEGILTIDTLFAARWADLKKAGVRRGAYHFFHPAQDPIAQAEHFVRVMGPLDAGDLPPSLDLEVDDGLPASKVYASAKAFLDKVQALTGRIPIVYGPRSLLSDCRFPANPPYALWQASQPPSPAPWHDWTFYQYDEKNGVDYDYFKGDMAALDRFIASSKV